jgi:hypothetical protein
VKPPTTMTAAINSGSQALRTTFDNCT